MSVDQWPHTTRPTVSMRSAAEQVVGLGFRCSLACLRTADNATSRQACAMLQSTLEAHRLPARLVADFSAWALAVEASAERPIAVLPVAAAGFCRDECLAISLVAACQHDSCPALKACAFALLGSSDLGRALAATDVIAHTLLLAEMRLRPAHIVQVAGFVCNPKGAGSRLN